MNELPRLSRLMRVKTDLEIYRELKSKPEDRILQQLQRTKELKK
jgi:hypothetical protein